MTVSSDGAVTNGVSHSFYVKMQDLVISWRNLSVVKFIVRAKTVIFYLSCANAQLLGAVAVYSMDHTRKQKAYPLPRD